MKYDNEKLREILKYVKNNPETASSRLHYELKKGYSLAHIFKILRILEKKGLVLVEKKGRVRHLKITDKGLEALDLLQKIKKYI